MWAIIQTLLPGNKPSSKPSLAPRPGVKYGGLAIADTKDLVKAMEEEMLGEGAARAAAVKKEEDQDDRRGSSRDRDGKRDEGRRDSRDRDRKERRRSRSRSRDRRRRSRSRSRDRRDRNGSSRGRKRSRSASPRGRSPARSMPEEPELYAVYRVSILNYCSIFFMLEEAFAISPLSLYYCAIIINNKR